MGQFMPDSVSNSNLMLQRSVELEVNCSVQQAYEVERWMSPFL